MSILFFIWRQRGRVVRDLKPGDPEFKSRSDHQLAGFVRGSPWFLNSSATLVHSQLVCLLPVVILNLLSSFQLFVSLALKNPSGEWSITYVCMYVCYIPSQPFVTRVHIISLKLQKNVPQMRCKLHRPIWSEVAVAARSLPCDRTIFVIEWLVMTVLRRNYCFQPIRGGSSVGLNICSWHGT